ncbi:MAG: FlgB family protein [Roseobacter sp.]|jgi:flagellar basal-body rod protein FlgB|nr:FlgB family protein [Roseobacter sp.]
MFKNLEVFKMSHAMAIHAGQKQAVTAQNVANSDTPGYQARDIAPFSDAYGADGQALGMLNQRATRSAHLNGSMAGQTEDSFVDPNGIGSPNGNTVSLENEMLKSLDAKRQHDRAMAIYKSSLGILRSTLARA